MHTIVNRMNKAYTLVELMVAIGIAGFLIALAVPAYRSYQVQAKLIEVMQVLEAHIDEARKSYVAGTGIPSSVLGMSSGAFTAYTNSPYIDFVYYDDGASWANDGRAAMVQAVLSSNVGGGIDGFTAGTSGTNNRVTMAFLASGELIQMYCGSWVDDGTQVPVGYLPTGCQDDAFSADVTG